MAKLTEEMIKEARKMDVLTYLKSYEPNELVQISEHMYSTKTHDSLKISNGKWMWWSRGFGGHTALDYLIKVKGMGFREAVHVIRQIKCGLIPQIKNDFLRYAEAL